jgi:hypoxanthine phosphoribosyltransferase
MLVVSFEDSVLNTEKSIKLLEQFLDRPRTKRTKRVLKQQNLPRTQISAGKATSSFSFNSDSSTSEAEIYKKIANEITATGSPSAVQEFKSAISKYNLRWPSPLATLENTWV